MNILCFPLKYLNFLPGLNYFLVQFEMSSHRLTSESRRSEFKNQGLTQDEFRRRREENSVELRKAKKEDTLNKRRNIVDVKPSLPLAQGSQLGSYVDDFSTTGSQEVEVKFA